MLNDAFKPFMKKPGCFVSLFLGCYVYNFFVLWLLCLQSKKGVSKMLTPLCIIDLFSYIKSCNQHQ